MHLKTDFIEKLRHSGLRPTKQRLKICDALFNTDKTFHFTINDLSKIIREKLNEKISLATVYNTVNAFQKKGYLKEINIGSEISYFDTNTTLHHHFYDEQTKELIDINSQEVEIKKSPIPPSGKKIEGIEVTFKISKKSSL